MSYSIIREIFCGRRGTHESVKISDEYLKEANKSNEAYDKLEKTLNEEQKELLKDYYDSLAKSEMETAFLFYAEGYKVGLLTGVESMQK